MSGGLPLDRATSPGRIPGQGLAEAPRLEVDPFLVFILCGIEGKSADEIAYTKKRGSLEYQISVDQVPILLIYRFWGDTP